MAADFSRVRMDPLLDFAGVELKQGGVVLDADVNEQVAIIDRRLRALASDTLGRARVSSTTPDGFKITVVSGKLMIGRGRMYVDGLLAHCHGAVDPAKREFDDVLAETEFSDGVDYAGQPYLPSAPNLPTSGQALVYLDLWNRELTHLERPELVEHAVGVETSARIQMVWQVKVLVEGVTSGTTCGTELTSWDALTAPSTGRLTTGTYEVAPVDDPCELPPTGGYRGLENQLYRVEIHDGGQPGGGATFKWSRENASVGCRVASIISATELQVGSLGRDDVLRLKSGDWVEITDDVRELAGKAGEIRRVTVNETARRINFTGALPAQLLPQPGNFPDSEFPRARNLRIRRWDQKNKVYRTDPSGTPVQVEDIESGSHAGLIAVPAAGIELLLEDGITVAFDSVGSTGLKPGDYWVFAARTADASVESLDQEPPRGIHHHYARLGVWDVASGAVTDCRPGWPPASGDGDCACTLCVSPKSHADGWLTIQDAVDKLRSSGGTLCLAAGSYLLEAPVRIAGARSIRIAGQGPATIVGSAGTVFQVERSTGVSIEQLTVYSLAARQSAISVRTAFGLALHHLAILAPLVPNPDAQGAAIALGGLVAGLNIHDNLLVAADGVRALEPDEKEAPKVLLTAAAAIDNNVFLCRDSAIKLDGLVGHAFETRATRNQVVGPREVGVSLSGLAFPGASVRIADNNIQVEGAGVRCSTGGLWIGNNKIQGSTDRRSMMGGAGIALVGGAVPSAGIAQAQLVANQIAGFPRAGIEVDAPVRDLIVKLNIIEQCGTGIVVTGSAKAGSVAIDNNQLRDITGLNGQDGAIIVGIGLVRTEVATVSGNVLRRIGVDAGGSAKSIAGISAQAVDRTRIIGNEITEVGPEEFGGTLAAISLVAPYRQAEISSNHVDRDAEPTLPPSPMPWYALRVQQPMPGVNISSSFGDFRAHALDMSRILAVSGHFAWIDTHVAGVDPALGVRIDPPGSSASILGNSLSARGSVPAVDVAATGDLLFSDNRCELRWNNSTYAVQLISPVAIVSANRVRGGEASINVPIGTTTAMGNITTGMIHANLPAAMAALNLNG